jgi:hypothetical protein
MYAMSEAGPGETARVQVVFASKSGLARDAIANTFHFHAPTLSDAVVGEIANALHTFYAVSPETGVKPISEWLSSHIDTSVPALVKCYDLGDPVLHDAEGHVTQSRPLHEGSFSLPANTQAVGPLPNEVAITLSYWADRNVKRHRGRIYIGTLDRQAMTAGGDTAETRVNAACHFSIASAASVLAQTTTASGARWGVFSTTDNLLRYPIGGGWVDDAFDTVRKRGLRPSYRRTFAG